MAEIRLESGRILFLLQLMHSAHSERSADQRSTIVRVTFSFSP